MPDPLTVVALFGAGVASFLAPCVVPLVPAYLATVGTSGGRHGTVGPTLVFVTGFTSVFVLFGATAGWLGSTLTDVQDAIRVLGGLVLCTFGIGLVASVFRRTLSFDGPALAGRLSGRAPAIARPFVIGVAFGAAWTPCVGPLLASALVLAADSAQVGRGVILLGAYGLGVGLPFVVLSLAIGVRDGLMAQFRTWSERSAPAAGAMLLALGILLVSDRYGAVSSWLSRFAVEPPVS